MLMSSHLLQRGISLWKSGNRLESQRLFKTIIYNDRQNEAAWIWYIHTQETNKEKKAALEDFLAIFPQHPLGRKALADLRLEEDSRSSDSSGNEDTLKGKSISRTRPASIQEAQSVQKSRSSSVPWFLIVIGLYMLLIISATSISRYNSLQIENRKLIVNNQSVSENLAQLRNDYEILKSNNLQLTDKYKSLVNQFNWLNNEYSILSKTYDSLYLEHTQLIEKYNVLTGDYNYLNNIAVKPPYIVVHDRTVDTTFYDIDGQLVTWTTPFSGLEYSIEHGTSMRSLIINNEWPIILVKTKDGTPLSIRDFSVFVTPTTFQKVVPELYAKSSSPYQFINRLWYMIGQLSNYASEDVETPRYSLETLLAGGGDCEDLSILFASLVQAAPVDWYVDLVYVDSNNINHPQRPDHVVVYIDTGQETFIVETTNDQEMLPYTNGITGWLAGNLNSDENYPVYLR